MNDPIERQAAIDAITAQKGVVDKSVAKRVLYQLPSADAVEREHGKWIMHIDDLFPAESTMECSKCHHEQSLIIDDNFCPNCGAKMDEVEE